MPARVELSARFLHRLHRVALEAGIDLGGADRPLPAPTERTDFERFCDLLEEVERRSGLADLGLRMARTSGPDVMDPASAVAAASPTVRAGIEAGLRFEVLWASVAFHRFESVPGGARVAFGWPAELPARRAVAIADQWAAVELVRNTRLLTGRAVIPMEVVFGHEDPAARPGLESFFGRPVRFGGAETRVTLGDDDLDAPVPGHNPVVAEWVEAQARAAASELVQRDRLTERVRAALRRHLGRAPIRAVGLARQLALSTRQLQRELQAEGTSFAALLDQVRRERALEELARGRPIGEVAELAGFAAPRAFHRAFRRWTGTTPSRWLDSIPSHPQ